MSQNRASEQHPAVSSVAKKAKASRPLAEARLADHGISTDRVASALEGMGTMGRLTLNFHPDRRDSMGRTVAAGLLADGRYRSQFETGISNGGRFAVAGGDRPRWEALLFDNVYDAEPMTRPVYGALDLFIDSYGGAPRFGSSFVVLEQHCLSRATLCVGDSHVGPVDLGTSTVLTSILAGAVEDCLLGDGFGRRLSVDSFLEGLSAVTEGERSARELDRYIEAQVHGGIDLGRDVACVVLDPSFRQSDIERDIEEAASRYGFELAWNEGSEMDPGDIDPGFRGSDMQRLARSTARHEGVLDAAAIGRALDDLPFTPPSVSGDPEESPRQRYKKLWHCCLKFGRPQR